MGNRAVVWEPLRAGLALSRPRGGAVIRTVVLATSLALNAGCAYVLRWPSVQPITQLDQVDYRVKQVKQNLRRELSDEEQEARPRGIAVSYRAVPQLATPDWR
jgi:hypothetical protein